MKAGLPIPPAGSVFSVFKCRKEAKNSGTKQKTVKNYASYRVFITFF